MNRATTGTLKVYLDGVLKHTETTPINYNSNPNYTSYVYDITGINTLYFTLSGSQSYTESHYTRLEKTLISP